MPSNIALSIAFSLSARASSTWATPASIETAILSLSISALPRLSVGHDQLYRERAARPLSDGPGDSPALGASRRLQPHGDQIWLRHRPLRRLHGPYRRQRRALVPGADRAARRQLR